MLVVILTTDDLICNDNFDGGIDDDCYCSIDSTNCSEGIALITAQCTACC